MRWLENVRQSTNLLGEAARCVHIADREGDIFELFCAATDAGTNFLIRTCVNRVVQEGGSTVQEQMEEVPIKGTHGIELVLPVFWWQGCKELGLDGYDRTRSRRGGGGALRDAVGHSESVEG